jgi:dTDP-4-dehydrorhamnose 3,5-epimerase
VKVKAKAKAKIMTEDRRPMTDDGRQRTKDQGRRTKDEITGFSISTSASTSVCSLPGVLLQPLAPSADSRGCLVELFRADVLEQVGMGEAQPVMGYLSMTKPGVVRGPHEHREQTDFLVFAGPSDFEVTLWDNRPGSPTFGRRETLVLGASRPATLMLPPRVVHAYRNIGKEDGCVLNFPNRLYKGRCRKEPVDEIRHEDDPGSSFKVEVKVEVKAKAEVKAEARTKD